uniref:UspA domain-containing protein n=1 Tax=Aegilops tauschii subsp. strangulata TaxID=200361 RepID=A0A453FPF7_AEGTS
MAANSSSPLAGGDAPAPALPPVRLAAGQAATIQPSSPRYFFSSLAGKDASSHRRIAIAVDLSDESAFAVRWAVQNYLRPGDAVVLLHVRPTSVLYGADWGRRRRGLRAPRRLLRGGAAEEAGGGLRRLHLHQVAGPGAAARRRADPL